MGYSDSSADARPGLDARRRTRTAGENRPSPALVAAAAAHGHSAETDHPANGAAGAKAGVRGIRRRLRGTIGGAVPFDSLGVGDGRFQDVFGEAARPEKIWCFNHFFCGLLGKLRVHLL